MPAAHHARETFGDEQACRWAGTLRLVGEATAELGIDVGSKVRARYSMPMQPLLPEAPYFSRTKTA